MSQPQVDQNERSGGHARITEEALNSLRGRMDREYSIEQPYNRDVTRDAVIHYLHAIGDVNELWTDERRAKESVWAGSIAPPCFLYSVHWGSWDFRRGQGLPGVHGLHSRDRWRFFLPLRVGDRIQAVKKLVGLEEKHGSFAGRSFIQTHEISFKNQRGELVATCHMSGFRTERDEARKRGKYAEIPPTRYSEADIQAIEAAYDAEIIRGTTVRFWDDVSVGEELQPVIMGPLTSADCIAWVMGVGSPHIRSGQYWLQYRRRSPMAAVVSPETGIPEPVERVHWDNWMAQEAGLPYAYDYGSQRGGASSRLLTNWMGDSGFLVEHDVMYRGMNFLGDTTTFSGTVVEKFERSGNSFVSCEIKGENQRKESILLGRAVVALPTRALDKVKTPIEGL